MFKIKMYNNLKIQALIEDREFFCNVRDYFTDYVDGYRFMPKFQSGGWDGKVCLFDTGTRTIPFGLLPDLIACAKKHDEKYEIDKGVVDFFSCIKEPQPKYDLTLKPREYQEECIISLLKLGKGIVRVATAGGKSLIIAYIAKELIQKKNIKKILIIVPTIMLVEQFYDDLIYYGGEAEDIGRIYDEKKELDRVVTISTWQSLQNRHDILKQYDCVFCDEVHIAKKSLEVKSILANCINAKYRFGLTGTLPEDKLELWNIKAYLGPVLKDFPYSYLKDRGYIAECNIHAIHLKYNKKFEGEYNKVKDEIFQMDYRLDLIQKITDIVDGNVLILVGKVEKEGEFFKKYMTARNYTNKEVIFISGETKPSEREYWRKELTNRKNVIIIATYPVFQMGVNIPSLKNIIFAAPFKSKIRVLQSIGRSLRLHTDKVNGAYIFDIIDGASPFRSYGNKRLKYYRSEGFGVTEHNIREGEFLQSFLSEFKFT